MLKKIFKKSFEIKFIQISKLCFKFLKYKIINLLLILLNNYLKEYEFFGM